MWSHLILLGRLSELNLHLCIFYSTFFQCTPTVFFFSFFSRASSQSHDLPSFHFISCNRSFGNLKCESRFNISFFYQSSILFFRQWFILVCNSLPRDASLLNANQSFNFLLLLHMQCQFQRRS